VGADPQTPVFAATKGMPVRFRMIHPAGLSEQVFTLHGHVWQEEPYINGSTEIGNNPLSQSQGSRDSFGPNVSFDVVIDKAGGAAGVTGDYLYRTFVGNLFPAGIWGLFRVGETDRDICTITRFARPAGGKVLVSGVNTVNPRTGKMSRQVTIFNNSGGGMVELGKADVDPMTGRWPASGKPFEAASTVRSILVRSDQQGEATASAFITPVGEEVAKAAPRRQKPVDERPNELELFNAVPQRTATLIEAESVPNPRGPSTVRWTVRDAEGKSQPVDQNGRITIRPGETIQIAIKEGTHGLTFLDGDAAKEIFHFEMPGTAFERKPEFGRKAIGTDGVGEGTVIATLRVRRKIPPNITGVDFVCSVHNPSGHRMAARFVISR
jgi:hypothetical protein